MTITILRPFAVLVTLVGRGFGSVLDAATRAAKGLGLVVRGSRYFDANGALVFVNRDEAYRVLVGYRWLVRNAGRWFVALPENATV